MAGGTRRAREMRAALRRTIPLAPFADTEPILEAALGRHLKALPPSVALWLALVAHVRHRHTAYDTLLDEGYDRDAARFFTVDEVNAVLTRWGAKRMVEADDQAEEDASAASEADGGPPQR